MGDGTAKTKNKGDRHGRPPFNLCFKSETLVGRSYILPGRPPGYVDFVARKFHVPDDFVCSSDCTERAGKSHDEFPKQKYPNGGVQESHKYGWYHDVSFRPMETAVSRKFNFPRSMNELFRLSER